MDAETYQCDEAGSPQDSSHKQTIKLKIGSGEEIQFIDANRKTVKLKADWNEKRDKLVFRTSNEEFPKVIYRYLLNENTMVEEQHCADEDGKPKAGSIIQHFEKVAAEGNN
eukprot:CAMPEP_0170168628 /NCGR_PEP_ID=MMETSP0040_2-20121228/1587_1 /TAXON_ID=641309 /ORGANISM="Lotharella oceanica, Strain CCMP622" /LENGTH=110 /DNA_ID=CAMNT_0010406913 /DNA_START=334 /DNA_END=666 /DNA_ORIENTATION=+